MKIHEALILELENKLTAGEARPGVVDAAYGRIIKEWAGTVTEDDRLRLHISKLLLEFEVSWLTLQSDLIHDLLSHRIVDNWGKENVPGWHDMDPKQKSTIVAMHLAQEKALKKARDTWETVATIPGRDPHYRRDVENVEEFRGKILRSFLESFT